MIRSGAERQGIFNNKAFRIAKKQFDCVKQFLQIFEHDKHEKKLGFGTFERADIRSQTRIAEQAALAVDVYIAKLGYEALSQGITQGQDLVDDGVQKWRVPVYDQIYAFKVTQQRRL